MNMKVLAKRCGVSTATVSYALRDDPRISEAVRKRVQQTAKEIGYRPDSLGTSLVAYRNNVRQRPVRPKVAVLFENPPSSRRTALFQPHLTSFRHNIAHYGYEVCEYFLTTMKLSATDLAEKLHEEGIRGLVVAWGDWGERMAGFPWHEFTVVSAERNGIHPALDRVSVNHFSATDEAFERLLGLGASRIGLVCHDDLFLRVRKNIVGAYLMNVHRSEASADGIPPYFYRLGESTDRFAAWFAEHQPDAVLAHRLIDQDFFKQAGVRFPEDAQYAVIEIDDERAGAESGIIMNEDFGRVLADTLAGKLHYDDRVRPEAEGNLILVDGEWKTGATTRS